MESTVWLATGMISSFMVPSARRITKPISAGLKSQLNASRTSLHADTAEASAPGFFGVTVFTAQSSSRGDEIGGRPGEMERMPRPHRRGVIPRKLASCNRRAIGISGRPPARATTHHDDGFDVKPPFGGSLRPL